MIRTRVELATAVLGALFSQSALGQHSIVLSDGTEFSGEFQNIDPEGVTIDRDGAAEQIGWHDVYRLSAPIPGDWSELPDQVRRGVLRVQRGDYVAAEPLLEAAHARLQATSGPTSIVVAEALLRCRVARGAVADAVEPMLVLRTESERLGRAESAPGFDARFLLHPSVPPFWVPGQGPDASAWSSVTGGEAGDMGAWYEVASRTTNGFPMPAPAADSPDEFGLRFLADIVGAWTLSPETRARHRARLETLLDSDIPSWARAWARLAIGRSLLLDPDEQSQRLGLLSHLRVPAEHGRDEPYVAGLALAEAADAAERFGWDDEADAIKSLFWSEYTDHPAADWLTKPVARRLRVSPLSSGPENDP